jgi:hypothetical protein
MSVSPSFPRGGPSLDDVLLQRTFTKPTQPFVDGDLLEALATTPSPAPSTDATQPAQKSGTDASDRQDDPGATWSGSTPVSTTAAATTSVSTPSSDADVPGRSIDVRV